MLGGRISPQNALVRSPALRIARLVTLSVGRWGLARLTRTRVGDWEGRTDPVDVVGSIAPVTTVLVHDPDDWYFDERHALALHAAASNPKELWWCPGGGHGSDLLTPELAERIVGACETVSSKPAGLGPPPAPR